MQDHIARAMAAKGKIRVVTCVTTKLTNDICFLQGTSPVASIALGRTLAGAALLGSQLKQGQRLAVKFEGSGPLKKIIAESDWDGAVRGTVAFPEAVAPTVSEALGRAGFLTVTRDLGMKEPYSGTVQLISSEIAEDLAYYLTDSDQVPSAVGLGVSLAPDGQVSASGGFLIQSLPPSDETAVDHLMERIAQMPPLTSLLQNGTSPTALLELLLEGLEYNLLETTDLQFRCGCSRDKVERALLTVGRDELGRMASEDQGATVLCEFCKQQYHFERNELESLIAG
ncbi:MAG: Hsp33 family molecular chaperone HslO [Trichlorobacter sp.]|jgi:molecular chaperone Hsp33